MNQTFLPTPPLRATPRSPSVRIAALAALLLSGTALAQSVPAPAPAVDGRIERLKPGEFFWAPQIAPDGPITIIVSLKTQRAYAYRNGLPIGVSTVSTGSKGHATPTGVFTILQKHVDHKSNLYDDAPMPFMQRLTWTGIAMHAGNLPGYPASHGCIRLPPAFAKLLFGVTRLGLTVVITDDALVPIVAAKPGVLGGPAIAATGTAFTWNPGLSPSGPTSIVVSGRDRRMVVLRNGIEIGSSAITLDVPIDRTAAFTLQSVDATGQHWMRLPLPGEAVRTGELSAQEKAQGRLPEGFRSALAAVLVPGTTLLVTRETLASAGTGTALTVIEADPR
ncbi:MAG TPA: L,D-transpeptidase [Sphingomonas sp.]|nr:L,D-transpeptidase [Sphingomonas sp.]